VSLLQTSIVVISIMVSVGLSLYSFFRRRALSKLLVEVSSILLVAWLLHAAFGFPAATEAIAKGVPSQQLWSVVGLYLAMSTGMLAQHLYGRFMKAPSARPKFNLGSFIAPLFVSPIVFIPLFASLQTVEPREQASLMALLVAFENGFFFKNYVDQHVQPHANVQAT